MTIAFFFPHYLLGLVVIFCFPLVSQRKKKLSYRNKILRAYDLKGISSVFFICVLLFNPLALILILILTSIKYVIAERAIQLFWTRQRLEDTIIRAWRSGFILFHGILVISVLVFVVIN